MIEKIENLITNDVEVSAVDTTIDVSTTETNENPPSENIVSTSEAAEINRIEADP